jgi:hypothetical protein
MIVGIFQNAKHTKNWNSTTGAAKGGIVERIETIVIGLDSNCHAESLLSTSQYI